MLAMNCSPHSSGEIKPWLSGHAERTASAAAGANLCKGDGSVKTDYRNNVRISAKIVYPSLPGGDTFPEMPMPRADSRTSAKKQIRHAPATTRPNGSSAAPTVQIAALSGDPNFMTSLARGLAVIQAFAQGKRQVTIAQLSGETGFS